MINAFRHRRGISSNVTCSKYEYSKRDVNPMRRQKTLYLWDPVLLPRMNDVFVKSWHLRYKTAEVKHRKKEISNLQFKDRHLITRRNFTIPTVKISGSRSSWSAKNVYFGLVSIWRKLDFKIADRRIFLIYIVWKAIF